MIFSRVHATLQPALSVCRSVGWSVRPSRLAFFAAPAHPHATKVAVYPALLIKLSTAIFCMDCFAYASFDIQSFILQLKKKVKYNKKLILSM